MAKIEAEEWPQALQHFLVTAGTVGRKQSEISTFLRNRASAAEYETLLESWWAERKVDQYKVTPESGRGGRSIKIWRATTLMETV